VISTYKLSQPKPWQETDTNPQKEMEKALIKKKKIFIAGHGGLPVIPAIGRLKQEDGKFEASVGYIVRILEKKKSYLQGCRWG
jgi:hypothetical protein